MNLIKLKMKTLKLEVYGRVQGVFFRANTKDYCDKNGIKGRVMNQDDGSVLVVAQGSSERLKNLVGWLKSSPGASKVDEVKVLEKEAEKFDDFRIIREDSFLRDKKKALLNLKNSLSKTLNK